MHRTRCRIAAATFAAISSLVATGLVAPTSVGADAGVGANAFLAVNGHELDAGFVQVLQGAIDSQFVGIEVAVVRDRLVLSGYATPGAHSAVLALVGHALQNPVPVPVALDIVSPDLGLGLPFLDLGTDLVVPNLGSLLAGLGVVDNLRIVR